MANPDGTPIWYELATPDADAAQRFYAEVVGWSVAPFGDGEGETEGYHVLTAPDGNGAGGIMTPPEGTQLEPGWYSYIGVQDVDGAAEKVKQLGGAVLIGPMDIPDVGRVALVADPQGVPFYVMRGDGPEDSKAFGTKPGHCGWHELATSDQQGALEFYGRLFGWRSTETMPMGDMGDYCFVDHHGTRLGAVMTAGAGWPTRWAYYFAVPSIDAATDRIGRAGGAVTQGPHAVPGGQFVIMATDPQGVAFALVGGK